MPRAFGLNLLADYSKPLIDPNADGEASCVGQDCYRKLDYIFLEWKEQGGKEFYVGIHDQAYHEANGTVADSFYPGDKVRFIHLYVKNSDLTSSDSLLIESAQATFANDSNTNDQYGPFESPSSKDISLKPSPVRLKDNPKKWASGGGSAHRYLECIGYRGYNDAGPRTYSRWPSVPKDFPWVFKDLGSSSEIQYNFSFELKLFNADDDPTTSIFKFDPKWKLKNGSF